MKQQSTDTLAADLKALAKILKRAFNVFQVLANQADSPDDCNSFLYKISQENKYLLQVLKKHKDSLPEAHLQNFEKYKLKIREALNHIKSKYDSPSTHKDLKGFSQQVEFCLKIFEKTGKFHNFISKIYTIINDQLRIFKIKIEMNQQNRQLSATGKLPTGNSLKEKSQKCPLSLVRLVNYSSIYKLDLDIAHIRSSVAIGQKNQMEWAQSQIERNKAALQQIEEFTQQYYLFRLKFKNKVRSYLCPAIDNKQNMRVKTSVHEKLYRNVREERRRRTQVHEKQNREEGAKVSYKVSNLYVSGSEFDAYCESNRNRWVGQCKTQKRSGLLLYQAFKDCLSSKYGTGGCKEYTNFI